MLRINMLVAGSLLALLAGCARNGEIDPSGGITTTRNPCPAVGIPAYTGDVTLFDPAGSRDASAIDVVVTMTNVKHDCTETGNAYVTNVSFDVVAQRRRAGPARQIVVPYFSSVIQGGRVVVSKQTGQVVLNFADGQARAQTSGGASASVSREAATLSEEVQKQITRRRKAGDPDAAIDPLSIPSVRSAVQRATFEVLVGFQLTNDQLQYNATR